MLPLRHFPVKQTHAADSQGHGIAVGTAKTADSLADGDTRSGTVRSVGCTIATLEIRPLTASCSTTSSVCLCLCMCVCTCMFVRLLVFTSMLMCASPCLCVYMCLSMFVCLHICLCVFTCMFVCVCVCV